MFAGSGPAGGGGVGALKACPGICGPRTFGTPGVPGVNVAGLTPAAGVTVTGRGMIGPLLTLCTAPVEGTRTLRGRILIGELCAADGVGNGGGAGVTRGGKGGG